MRIEIVEERANKPIEHVLVKYQVMCLYFSAAKRVFDVHCLRTRVFPNDRITYTSINHDLM